MSRISKNGPGVKSAPDSRAPRCLRCKSLKLVTHAAVMNGQPIFWFECSECDSSWAASDGQLEFPFSIEQSTHREGVNL